MRYPTLALAVALIMSHPLQAEPSPDDALARAARSILSDKCFNCHGPDEKGRKAGLRLDQREGAIDVLLSEDTPELLLRILSDDPQEVMPPPRSKLTLSAEEIDVLKRWLAAGAPYHEHWAFRPVRKTTPPDIGASEQPIDRFILARLREHGLKINPQADRERLIRRLAFDITGLPPSLGDIDAFLNDDSENAYEKWVDHYLKQPSYGERMASDWMDVARYSDSYGYQVDRDRYVWPWRDWVIKAFNQNMPYDQFITEQLAGDLLPNATDKQILATTFNRLHPQKVEGGSVPEEFRVEYVADRTHTFGTAFLGLTMECARCHDHKYDPISQREYFSLFGFFNNIDEAGLYSFFTPAVPTPTLTLTDDATRTRLRDLESKITAAEHRLTEVAGERRAAFKDWLDQQKSPASIPGEILHLDFEKDNIGGNSRVAGKFGTAVKLTGDDAVGTQVGNFQRYQPFSVSLWMNTPDIKERAVVFHRSRAWTDAGSRGYQLLIENGKLSASLIHFWPGNAIRVKTRDVLAPGEWHHVAITYDGSSRADGLRIFVNGAEADCEVVRDRLTKDITGGGGDTITIGERFRDRGFTGGLVDEFRVFDRELTPIEVSHVHDGTKPTSPNEDGYRFYLHTVDSEYRQALSDLRKLREEYNGITEKLTEIMVMRERDQRRPTFVLERGEYDAPGERVEPNVPAILPKLPKDMPRNRLALARWLTDPVHPLTARVVVNRIWQLYFGEGLVRTPEDFGNQGSEPTHPELLDWLAADFVAHGWDVKRLVKQIVMSQTYRQSSARRPETLTIDPQNRLLSRFPVRRLPAEMIRDNALSVSGLLVDRVGGPPARPYEVTVSFAPVERAKGPDLYRRSLYTYWKQSGPAPVLMTLDASKREVCRVKREKTSSPLQALVMLNGIQFVEAARVLGEKSLVRHPDDPDAMIVEMFRLLTGRRPEERERTILRKLYDTQCEDFAKHPERAEAFLKVGDAPTDATRPPAQIAAAGVVASTLMNHDESVMKR